MSIIGLILKFILSIRFPSHASIADITRRRFGEAVLDFFRSWERATEKYQKCLADIAYLEACKDANLVPRFLLFKLANRKLKRSSEAARSRRRLLDVELKKQNKVQGYTQGIRVFLYLLYIYSCYIKSIMFVCLFSVKLLLFSYVLYIV